MNKYITIGLIGFFAYLSAPLSAYAVSQSGPIVYKTKADYLHLVPISLSADKTIIVGMPAPTDVYYRGILAIPTPLSGGYLLDNRGVGLNTAFTSYTYENYSKLPQTPSGKELMDSIVDKDPFTELYVCPRESEPSGDVAYVNKIIGEGKLSQVCQQLVPSAVPRVQSQISPVLLTKYLKVGMTDAQVRVLQVFLNTHGYQIAATGPGSLGQESTYFGEKTSRAVKLFQSASGLPSTGYVGPMTVAYINKIIAGQ